MSFASGLGRFAPLAALLVSTVAYSQSDRCPELGLRYWDLKADGTINLGSSAPLRLNEFESRRAGLTATLGWRY